MMAEKKASGKEQASAREQAAAEERASAKEQQKQFYRIEEMLNEHGFYISTTVGMSMYPLLRNRRDTIVIRPAAGHLKKYDVPLYKRGDAYILHRIVKVTPDGYVICGDNCLHREYDITDHQIIGVLSEIVRDEKKVRMDGLWYRIYCRVWVASYPIRAVCKIGKMAINRLIRRKA